MSYSAPGATVKAPDECPNCGGEDFSWHVYVFANDSAPGHNLMGLHDVHVTAFLACDDCSDATATEIASALSDTFDREVRVIPSEA